MTYYLFDSKGFVGDLASIHGLYEMRQFLYDMDSRFSDFFDLGYTLDIAPLWVALCVAESPDLTIDETIVNLRDLLQKCHDIAIISDAAETEEEVMRKKEVKKKYALPKGKRRDATTRCMRALELYRPWGRRAQNFAHAKLEEMAKEIGAEMTRGTHPFDLVIGENMIDVVILVPDDHMSK